MLEFGLLHILEHDPLRPFFTHDPFVVREVERGSLDAAIGIAGGEDHIDHPNRGQRAEGRIPERGVDWERVFQPL